MASRSLGRDEDRIALIPRSESARLMDFVKLRGAAAELRISGNEVSDNLTLQKSQVYSINLSPPFAVTKGFTSLFA